jgi:hypothetical protein
MENRLYDLFLLDRQARIKMYGAALAVSIVVGIASMLNGIPVRASATNSCIFTLAILLIWSAIYCLKPHRLRQPSPTFAGRRLALSSGLIAFAVAMGVSTQRIEAEILNRRLLGFARRRLFSDPDAVRLADALNYARRNRVPIAATAVSTVGSKLLRSGTYSESLHKAVEAAAATQSTLHGSYKKEDARAIRTLPEHSVFDQNYLLGIIFSLDTKAFLSTRIENCVVHYGGGPVILKNTEFVNCEFNFSASPQAKDLLLLLTQRNDPDFTYKPNEIVGNFSNSRQR